jgi:hypothetical protein
MKLHLPASYDDLTLAHLMVLETTDDPVKRVQAVTGKTFAELRRMPQALLVEASSHLEQLQKKEKAIHKPILTLDGVEYGFVPDWENFSAGEWIDMETYTKDFWQTAHKAMSILYRPIDRKWGDTYTVQEYTAKEDPTPFLSMPAPAVAGALLFFWTTEAEQLSSLRSSLIRTTREATSLLTSGGGIPYSTHWQVRMYYRWKRLQGFLSATLSRILPTSKTSRTSVNKNTRTA